MATSAPQADTVSQLWALVSEMNATAITLVVGRVDACYTTVMLAAHAWAARLLVTYGPACQAQALSLWACTHGRLDQVCDWLGTQRLYNLLRTRWLELAPKLRAGQPASLAAATHVLPVHARHEGLVGALVFTGRLPSTTGTRALLDDLTRRLSVALRDPLPPPEPALLTLPLAQVAQQGGLDVLERHAYAALLERHGGNVSQAARVLAVPRQTLHHRIERLGVPSTALRLQHAASDPADFEDEARELERQTCLLVLQRYRGDIAISAAAVHLTVDAWRTYLRALAIDPPAPPRPPRRKPPAGRKRRPRASKRVAPSASPLSTGGVDAASRHAAGDVFDAGQRGSGTATTTRRRRARRG